MIQANNKVTGEAGRFTFDDVTPGDVAVSVVIRREIEPPQHPDAQAFYDLSAGSIATPEFQISPLNHLRASP